MKMKDFTSSNERVNGGSKGFICRLNLGFLLKRKLNINIFQYYKNKKYKFEISKVETISI